ncbi:hypothetical protein EW145_g106 [Phellinidium pouzarii]|uniref:Peptidase A1 domain-containing protein n=1 Tax=Phellinidium pouzarii TaxID=167371 RepID=A0A4V3XE45_9AGAM|nr:hypothetical protein EW145_g106 [Phellinidium pouzarii]
MTYYSYHHPHPHLNPPHPNDSNRVHQVSSAMHTVTKFATALALLPILTSATPTPRLSSSRVIPLSKRSSLSDDAGVININALHSQVKHMRGKIALGFANYEKNMGHPHPNSNASLPHINKRATASDPLTDDDERLWQGTILIGTPAKKFTVDFDTGSSDLFLPGPSCGSSCAGHIEYNPSLSSTAKDSNKTFSLTYGDGSTVTGEQFTDTVVLGGLSATQQRVGAAIEYSDGLERSQFAPDGLLGMAFQQISNYDSPPVFQTLALQKQTSASTFGFTLLPSGSELYLGGIDTSKISGSLTYMPVTQMGYWQIKLGGASVGSKSIFSTPVDAIVDTGTTLLVGDSTNVKNIYAAIPGSKDASESLGQGFYTIPCDAVPSNVSLTLGGKKFAISAATLNLGVVSSGSRDCIGGIMADDTAATSLESLIGLPGGCNLNGVMPSSTHEIRLATWNLRFDSQPDSIGVEETLANLPPTLQEPARYTNITGEKPWSTRRVKVAQQLMDRGVVIVCFQEALVRQVDDMLALLSRNGETWKYVGVGRDDGKEAGEFSPILFNTSYVEAIHNDTFWLSHTPFVPGSKFPGAGSVRICTVAHLRLKGTGHSQSALDIAGSSTEITILNTHLDDQSDDARRLGASLVLARAEHEAAQALGLKLKLRSRPVIVTGDFNSSAGSATDSGAYKIITGALPPVQIDRAFFTTYPSPSHSAPSSPSLPSPKFKSGSPFHMVDMRGTTSVFSVSGNIATYTGFSAPENASPCAQPGRIDFVFGGCNGGW